VWLSARLLRIPRVKKSHEINVQKYLNKNKFDADFEAYLKVPELDGGAGAATWFGVQPEDAESFSALGAPGEGGGSHPHRGTPLVVGHHGRVAIFLFFLVVLGACLVCPKTTAPIHASSNYTRVC
jgi:hypothetical protein